jgi:hypothetical protein
MMPTARHAICCLATWAVFLISCSGEGEAEVDATSESRGLLYSIRLSPSSSVSVFARDMLVDVEGELGGSSW